MELPPETQKQIEKGVDILRQGGVIAFPTDTVFGMGSGAFIDAAVERVYQIKNRSRNKALPLLLGDVSQVHEVADFVPPYAWRLLTSFSPGGLTLVLYRSKIVKDIITGGTDTVAVRIPDHPVPLALIKGCGMPIIGTSANVSGQPVAFTADQVRQQLGDQLDLVIEDGPSPNGKESTVVDATGEIPVILREGAVSRKELEMVGEIV
jgi:L-threonylcarbamoyladenylate synthase